MILYYTVRYKYKNYDMERISYGMFNPCCIVLHDTELLPCHIILIFTALYYGIIIYSRDDAHTGWYTGKVLFKIRVLSLDILSFYVFFSIKN